MQSPQFHSVEKSDDLGVRRVRLVIVCMFAGCWATLVVLRLLHPFDFAWTFLPESVRDMFLPMVQQIVGRWSLTVLLIYPLAVTTILLLERRFPARPLQSCLSSGFVHDAMWVAIDAAAHVLIIGWYVRLLTSLYEEHLSFLTLPIPPDIPVVMAFLIGVVAIDFLRWFQHWLHHRIPLLWEFHAIHHSQRELNLFSDYRIHVVEYFVRHSIYIFPMLILGLDVPKIVAWTLFLQWHARFYHANIRTNLGPLRYVLVTPQSHRIHHSVDPVHRNRNYGALLSVWDHLFKTQHDDCDTYPATGISVDDHPAEHPESVLGILISPIQPIIDPFVRIFRRSLSVERINSQEKGA